MSTEQNKAVVRRYFEEALNPGGTDLLPELFATDCVMRFPHLSEPRIGLAAHAAGVVDLQRRASRFATHIEHLIAEGDLVAIRIRHDVTFQSDLPTRVGVLPATGKTINWTANAFFRVRDGKIIEGWIERDEAGMLQQLNGLSSPAGSK